MTKTKLKVALVQLSSTPEMDKNLRDIEALVSQAASTNPDLIALPENAPFLGPEDQKLHIAQDLGGPLMTRFAEMAKEHRAAILLGSFAERAPKRRTYNTSVLFSKEGTMLAHYRKLHLFDVETPSGEVLKESESVAPGACAITCSLAPWTLGLSICYDLRFPNLYQTLTQRGADLLTVPAAFTQETGMAHWSLLLRARAVENLSYVIAPNQCGNHYSHRWSYGHSMIVSPWGEILAQCDDEPGFAVATLDLELLQKRRAHFPTLSHRRTDF